MLSTVFLLNIGENYDILFRIIWLNRQFIRTVFIWDKSKINAFLLNKSFFFKNLIDLRLLSDSVFIKHAVLKAISLILLFVGQFLLIRQALWLLTMVRLKKQSLVAYCFKSH